MIKSTLKYLKEVFNSNKKYDKCLYCGANIEGMKRKFCSTVCNQKYYQYKYSPKIKRLNAINIINPNDKPTTEELEKYDFKQRANKLAYKIAKCRNGTCMICKKQPKTIYRHHEDYNRGDLFILVCSKCHGFIKRYNNLKEKIFIQLEGGKK